MFLWLVGKTKNFLRESHGCETASIDSLCYRFRSGSRDDYFQVELELFYSEPCFSDYWGISKNWLELKIEQQ
jgi:hypothetical protein